MLFTLGDAEVSPKFSWIGIVIVVLSLVFDALHSNTQENVLQVGSRHLICMFTRVTTSTADP